MDQMACARLGRGLRWGVFALAVSSLAACQGSRCRASAPCCPPGAYPAPVPAPAPIRVRPLPDAPPPLATPADEGVPRTRLRYYDVRDLAARPAAQASIDAWVQAAPDDASVSSRSGILLVRGYPHLLETVEAWLTALRRGEDASGPPVPKLPASMVSGAHRTHETGGRTVRIHMVADIVGLELPIDTQLALDRAGSEHLSVQAGEPIGGETLLASLRSWLQAIHQEDTELSLPPGGTNLVVKGGSAGQAAVSDALTLVRRQLAWQFEPPLAGAGEASPATLRIYDVSDLFVDPVPVAMELPWPDGSTRSFPADTYIPAEELLRALHDAAGDIRGETMLGGATRAGRGALVVSGPHAFHEHVGTALGTLRRAYERHVLPPPADAK